MRKLYNKYIYWTFVSNVAVSIENTLSTHNVLLSISPCSEITRTFNYITKDILGQIGGIYYLSKIGNKPDKDPINFLYWSNIFQQSGYFLLSSSYFMNNTLFLPVAAISSILFNISFASYGAINAKCIAKLSENSNIGIAELYAKITMINTIASTVGMSIGMLLVSHEPLLRLMYIPILAVIRTFSYFRAVKNILN